MAGAHQAGANDQPDVRSARLGADAGRLRRWTERRRAEETNRGRFIPQHPQNDARWLRSEGLPGRQYRTLSAERLLLLFGSGLICRAIAESKVLIQDVAARRQRMVPAPG